MLQPGAHNRNADLPEWQELLVNMEKVSEGQSFE